MTIQFYQQKIQPKSKKINICFFEEAKNFNIIKKKKINLQMLDVGQIVKIKTVKIKENLTNW